MHSAFLVRCTIQNETSKPNRIVVLIKEENRTSVFIGPYISLKLNEFNKIFFPTHFAEKRSNPVKPEWLLRRFDHVPA